MIQLSGHFEQHVSNDFASQTFLGLRMGSGSVELWVFKSFSLGTEELRRRYRLHDL